MALGFIKKVFSFGKKGEEVEVLPPAEIAADLTVQTDAPVHAEEPVVLEHVTEISLDEAEDRSGWDADLPDPEPMPGISDETAEDAAAAQAEPVIEHHVAEISAEDAEELSDWDAGAVDPAPEPAPAPILPVEVTISAPLPQSDAAASAPDLPGAPDLAKERTPENVPVLPKGFSSADARIEEPVAAPKPKLTWFQRLRAGLRRTSSQLSQQISSLFTKRKLDEDTLEELEELLIRADLGVETAMRVTGALSAERYGRDVTGEDVARIMAGEIERVLAPVAKPLELDLKHKPHVILVVGVNGTGKTTTIGKLAAKLSGAGLKVMLAAGDTFRAAAIEQLKIWATRTGSQFIGTTLGADAAGLAFDAYKQAIDNGSDVLIIDTAGRLQNKTELMAELEKIVRVLGKLDPDAPHTVLQTLDATTGQNALQQVEIFRNVAGVSGLVMTKLDGTARGGILVAIAAKHKLPVYFIGVGEGIDDLEPFEAKDFAAAIAGLDVA